MTTRLKRVESEAHVFFDDFLTIFFFASIDFEVLIINFFQTLCDAFSHFSHRSLLNSITVL